MRPDGRREGMAWMARIEAAEAAGAAPLRLVPGIEALLAGEALWLRGHEGPEDLELALRKIPGATLFSVLPGGRLQEKNRRVPAGKAPEGSWIPLERWIAPAPQPAALPAQLQGRVRLKLIRAREEREPSVLLTTAATWAAYASEAPLVRLKPLCFAASRDGLVLIAGRPLPAIPGARYVRASGVAVPCGFAWSPPVDAEVLRGLLQLAPGDLAILEIDGGFEHIGASSFVAATRSAARRTLEGLPRE